MIWTAIREINGEMFSTKGEPWKPGIWALATSVAAVVGGLGFYWKIPDSVAEWLDYRFYDAKTAKAAFETWQAGSHIGLRLVVLAASFLLFYLVVFGIYAVKRLDYRKQYARAFGVRFATIRREHDVLDLTAVDHHQAVWASSSAVYPAVVEECYGVLVREGQRVRVT